MSAGSFDISRYETDAGPIHPCRVQPETIALDIDGTANDAPAGAVDGQGSANMGGSRRRNGINARYVLLRFTGAAPAGYSGDDVRVPVLTPAAFAAYTLGATGTYLGEAVEVRGRTSEEVN
jgi:hypothetical protein